MTSYAKQFQKIHRLHQENLRIARAIEKNLFRHVRPGYAIFFLCASAKNRWVHRSEIEDALVRGNVLTSLDEKELRKATLRLCNYHVSVGRLKRRGEFYTNVK